MYVEIDAVEELNYNLIIDHFTDANARNAFLK